MNNLKKETRFFYIAETKTAANTTKILDSLIPLTQDYSLATPFSDEIWSLQSKFHNLEMEVMAQKSFISEQFLSAKQNQKLANKQHSVQLTMKILINL